jgi:SAM-dependent methyltransferase
MSLESAYSDTYRDEALGRQVISIASWPRTRSEAAVFWGGSGQRVLDVGCGNGLILYNLRTRYSELYGIELSTARIETARRTLEGLPARIGAGNIEAGLDFESSFFDRIICADVLEHVVNVWPALQELHRLLKPQGQLVLTTPNIAALRRRLQLLLGTFPSTSAGDEGMALRADSELLDGGHVHYFTFSLLRKVLRRSRFTQIAPHGFGRLGRAHDWYPSLLSSSCAVVAGRDDRPVG